jgi:hypothetical protein
MERSHAALFGMLFLVAAAGIVVFLAGGRVTGLAHEQSPYGASSFGMDACGNQCLRDSDCFGRCGYCSQSAGFCVGAQRQVYPGAPQTVKPTAILDAHRACVQRCDAARADCYAGSRAYTVRPICSEVYVSCASSCSKQFFG